MPRGRRKTQRRKQRGGADDCAAVGKVRLPGGQCFDWYDTTGHAIMHTVDPAYHKQLKERVLIAMIEWRAAKGSGRKSRHD